MPINVLVNGAFGRMGLITAKTLSENPKFELVGQTSKEYDLKKSIIDSKAQVVIDFTNADAVYANTKAIIETGAHPVIGTTGLTLAQIHELQKISEINKLGGIIAPNFSLGAVLLMKYAKEIAKYMPTAEIIEFHHDKKLDSPSGTALRTAELILEGSSVINETKINVRETVKGARGATHKNIPIHAIRLPGLLAHEEVIFGNVGETLTLRHDSIDRACFMPGVVFACEKVMTRERLVYGLEEVL